MRVKIKVALSSICLLIFLLPAGTGGAKTVNGYVKKVIDGDSLIIKTDDGRIREVRLYGIDSPEYDQPFAKLSKNYLKKKVLKKRVKVKIIDRDRYKRDVCLVQRDDTLINGELVRLGYSWVYSKYCKKNFCNKWKKYQKLAKKRKKGLWKGKKPISPWLWKHK